jgi:macrodomain Ter protein organizer (MatP/YcbG family)
MAVSAKFDQKKLERTLKNFAKKYGETQSQAVVRWSVQTCRELAMETQVWGKVKTQQKQHGKIISDALNVVLVVDNLTKSPSGKGYTASNLGKTYYVQSKRALLTPESVNQWIEIHRVRRRRNTLKLPINERMICKKAVFNKAMTIRKKKAGMAKGGWLGAGQEIAKAQTGQDKIVIGKTFLPYAQRSGNSFGSAIKPKAGWKPAASITNSVEHTASNQVLAKTGIQRAIQFGLKKSINYYRQALRALNKKNL